MQDFMIFYCFISFTMGITSIVFSIIVYMQNRDSALKDHIFTMLSFTVIVVFMTLINYVRYLKIPDVLNDFFVFSTYLGCCLLIYTLPRFINNMIKIKWKTALDRAFAVLGSIIFVGLAVTFKGPLSTIFVNIMFVFLTFTILYAVTVSIYFSRKKGRKWDFRLSLSIAVVTIFLIPSFVVLDFYYDYFTFIHSIVPKGFYTLPGFYFFWNLSVLLYLSRQMGKSNAVNPVFDIPEKFIRDHDISGRETQILMLLIRGQSYREIGGRLFISPATVKTHAIHIYQKTGVKNKVELIHVIGRNAV